MSHKFKKNNCISDSESDEEIHNSCSEDSETQDSLTSIDDSDSDNNNVSDSKTSLPSVKTVEDSNLEESEINESSENESPVTSKDSSSSFADKNVTSQEKKLNKDHNFNRFSKKSESLEKSISRKSRDNLGDILALDSSASVNESKSLIEDSCNETCNGVEKTPFKNIDAAKSKIIEESSDSDASVEFVESFTKKSTTDSKKTELPKKGLSSNNSSVEVIEISQTQDSMKNLSQASVKSNNSSRSGLSNGTQGSTYNSMNDERKALERLLTDKLLAYQNILRAVKACPPSKLKDGGKLLQEKLARCKEEVKEIKEKLQEFGDVPEDSSGEKYSAKSNILYSTSDQVTVKLGKKGLETHRVQAALTVDALVTLHSSLQTCPAENELERDPKGLRVELMPHQKYALAWLLWREKQVPAGGILADDMGLGKTLTMIALILRAAEYKKQNNLEDDESPFVENGVKMYPGRTLVVCPSSLMGQWQGQIKQHCKSYLLSAMIHHGKPRELQAKKLAACDIVISSYGVIVEENKIVRGDKKGPLFRVRWERVIIDEGHVIKNPKTKTAQALCELEAKYRWCLTGTPVQNKELDMYSLLKFLRCSPFDSLPVWKRWVDNKSANGIQRLNTVVKSILLRRTKEELKTLGELQELPSKTCVPVYINLDEEEQTVYHAVLHFSKRLLAEFILQEQKRHGFLSDELRSQHHELLHSANEIKTTEIFVLLLRLRQICCLPGLIHSMLEKDSCKEDGIDPEDDPILQSLTSQMKRMSVGAPPIQEEFKKKEKILIESNPVFDINRPSGKIRKVIAIIKEAIEADDKIVIVSQWASLLQKLKVHILPLKIGIAQLDGSVPVKLRPKIIDDFNKEGGDVKVMLLSLTAGGVGLNLMGGNRLIIFEPHWNPQLESQACDRVYRVGQKKQVYIYKIICKETIEEKIELLQKKKLELANTVLKGELKMNRSKLTLADLKTLFEIHS